MSHPSPAQMPGRFGGSGMPSQQAEVDPDAVVSEVTAILEMVDSVRRDAADHDGADRERDGTVGGSADLAPLDTQAHLLEQAHDVLTTALEQLDRV